jgi:7-cyano-7-deazaguanine synthase
MSFLESPIPNPESRQGSSLVMLSGGLDSAVLAADEARTYVVHPVYVAGGLAWEEGEQRIIRQLLSRPPFSGADADNVVQPLARLEFSMRDVYPDTHWALTGTPPAYDTPDEDVYLHGRNIALLSKAAVYAASRRISRIVVAPLAGNPFPDATPRFFAALNAAFTLGLAAPIEIAAPFADLHKEDVVKMGARLGVPFELTLSCMNPSGTTHCGLCSKCRERRDAFQAAGITDPTRYANVSPR